MKKFVLLLLVLVIVGGTVFAFDAKSFPKPIEKGSLLITPMVGLGSLHGEGLGYYFARYFALSIPIAIEYALPINFALTVGGEIGIGLGFVDTTDSIPVFIPILAKVAWHPNFEVKGLDVYAAVKMGAAIGAWKLYDKAGAGFAFGVDVGVRYFFNNTIAIAGEVGYDYYNVKFKDTYTSDYWPYNTYTDRVGYTMGTYFRVGVTFKV